MRVFDCNNTFNISINKLFLANQYKHLQSRRLSKRRILHSTWHWRSYLYLQRTLQRAILWDTIKNDHTWDNSHEFDNNNYNTGTSQSMPRGSSKSLFERWCMSIFKRFDHMQVYKRIYWSVLLSQKGFVQSGECL